MRRIIISGPTGVGKTDFAVKLSEKLPIEVISMDSRQIYKYMDIGTAKPDPYQLMILKHHMIDIIEPNEYYNAFLYQEQAKQVEKEILNRGKIPIYVGGTGLYIDALIKGFFEGVPRDENIRRELSKLNEEEPGILRKMLEKFDPEAATKIHPQDIKRTIRALEVYLKTGKRISELQTQDKQGLREDFILIVLDMDRKELYERINLRVDKMIEHGLVDEVKELVERYGKEIESFKTIGYREIIDYLEGLYNLGSAIHLIKKHTRNYARRQLIYLRRFSNAHWFDIIGENTFNKVLEIIKKEACLA
ncbi:MAG: tRNA (adenosine(37)-N6)-dimethylallyltransferase MiaA [Fervidobacterium sp.]